MVLVGLSCPQTCASFAGSTLNWKAVAVKLTGCSGTVASHQANEMNEREPSTGDARRGLALLHTDRGQAYTSPSLCALYAQTRAPPKSDEEKQQQGKMHCLWLVCVYVPSTCEAFLKAIPLLCRLNFTHPAYLSIDTSEVHWFVLAAQFSVLVCPAHTHTHTHTQTDKLRWRRFRFCLNKTSSPVKWRGLAC